MWHITSCLAIESFRSQAPTPQSTRTATAPLLTVVCGHAHTCSSLGTYFRGLQERLAEQRAQADADPGYDSTFKGPRSKAEKKEKRKAILAAIGARPSCPCCGVPPQPIAADSSVRICTHTPVDPCQTCRFQKAGILS
jgi:hypothetical protein